MKPLVSAGEDIGDQDQQVPGLANHVVMCESLPFFLSVTSGLLLSWVQVLEWHMKLNVCHYCTCHDIGRRSCFLYFEVLKYSQAGQSQCIHTKILWFITNPSSCRNFLPFILPCTETSSALAAPKWASTFSISSDRWAKLVDNFRSRLADLVSLLVWPG